MDPLYLLLAMGGGFLAGVINTLAGNGSAITLSIMTELLGLPGNIANGTNRLGIFSQSALGSWAFYREGKLDIRQARPYILITFLGAIPGVWTALQVSNEQFRSVFGYLLIVMLLVILVKPERWIREMTVSERPNYGFVIPIFLLLGFYGGFIQMGMGIFFLAAMVLGAGYDVIRANAIKGLVIAIFTLALIVVFQYTGRIDWRVGLVIASGQALGGFLTARYASRYAQARIWAYRLLIIVVLASILKIFLF
ncbi:MAG: sulfite exporter TauE/SafE family protein [Lewinellaceae bacterium]|nr:sulfite exporter TauE/SafE family protein [Saprospiraceae bacterium]MCB9311981.1 sulfite exporter TauE/SafE family protein [Lewinellaceae bacterium]